MEIAEIKIKKTEDMKKYMREYMRDYNRVNKEKVYKNLYSYKTCEVCGGKFMSNSKTHHLKSKNHKIGELQNKLNQIQKLTK